MRMKAPVSGYSISVCPPALAMTRVTSVEPNPREVAGDGFGAGGSGFLQVDNKNFAATLRLLALRPAEGNPSSRDAQRSVLGSVRPELVQDEPDDDQG